MIYLLRTGGAWRSLPAAFPPWKSVYSRWRRWGQSGLWCDLLKCLQRRAQTKARFLDATHIKVHQDAHGAARKLGNQAIGATKGGCNSKLHVLVDGCGRAVRIILSAGNEADISHAPAMVAGLKGLIVAADKGYDSDALRRQLESAGNICVIPGKSNRKVAVEYDREFYKWRRLVENFFQRIKRFRRICQRVEKLSATFSNFVNLAACLDWLALEV